MVINLVRADKNKKKPDAQHPDNYAPKDNAEATALAMKWAAMDAAKRNKAAQEARLKKKESQNG